MAQRKIDVEPVEAKALETVRDEMALQGKTLDDMTVDSGMARATIGKSLTGFRATSVSEFVALCHALGLTPWRVLRQAEDAVRAQADDARTYTAEAEAKLKAVLQGNYTPAARHHEPDPLEGLGEENQDLEEK
ncbi:MAG: hypothetical protein MR522_04210 [Trueperella sp.]|uniref:hypothetical protein n=1 Tax=Trueperella sp. TaxID=2699835 RepID=UPI0025E40C05|nr:hypothetical protein [Trueperella sp.]MCI7305456.1 hypothetical protein [Trueperella sp.]